MATAGQSAVATANELDQFGKAFAIPDANALVWTTSDPNGTAAATGDGTPTAKVTVGANSATGTYQVTFSDPAAPALVVTAASYDVTVAVSVATTGSVELGAFA